MLKTRKIVATISLFAAVMFVAAACSSSSTTEANETAAGEGDVQASAVSSTSPEVEAGSHITATIADMSIALSTHTVPEGFVTFDITNNGPSLHELVVLKTNIAPGKLPDNPDEEGMVQEDAAGIVPMGEDGNIPPNTDATLTLHLKPGKYQIICNLPGHYAAGMYTDLTVTPAGAATPGMPPTSPEVETGLHIGATIQDMSIKLSTHSMPAGKVTFDITNNGPSLHELVVLKTDVALGQLPDNPDEAGQVLEEGAGIVPMGEDGNIPAGTTATLTLTLKPGTYQIICNLPGHYAAGMYTDLTVVGG
jgi:uncharacterized cupredoxin-like copper-binding protein